LAKQLGYTDAEIEAIKAEETRTQFAPEMRLALKFAENMALDAHRVTDEDIQEMRQYYSEPQLVELACVVGLTIYFNRFNTIFRVDLTGSDAPYESFETN